ncbi:MAG: hypothetical protein M0Q92_06105 [Methanoregula sp.]|nr:hypothetical protein [Methanoregula sp.]
MDIPPKGLLPLMYDMVDLLPNHMRPQGKSIVDILTLSVIAIVALYLIGMFVATLTGHADQIMTIFAAEITLVGSIAVLSIVLTVKKSIH